MPYIHTPFPMHFSTYSGEYCDENLNAFMIQLRLRGCIVSHLFHNYFAWPMEISPQATILWTRANTTRAYCPRAHDTMYNDAILCMFCRNCLTFSPQSTCAFKYAEIVHNPCIFSLVHVWICPHTHIMRREWRYNTIFYHVMRVGVGIDELRQDGGSTINTEYRFVLFVKCHIAA